VCFAYIREAHASDEWDIGAEVCYPQPKTYQERIEVATQCQTAWKLDKVPFYVLPVDSEFERALAPWPFRAYIFVANKLVFSSDLVHRLVTLEPLVVCLRFMGAMQNL